MNAASLTDAERLRLIQSLNSRKLFLDETIKWMKQSGWYSDDPVYHGLISARSALHGAVNHILIVSPPGRAFGPKG